MHVIVLGGGVIGVCSAWYLAAAGHRVTVIDRQPAVAMETSHANAGQVSPGYSAPWAAPGVPLKAVKWLLQKHGPLRISAKALLDPAMRRWVWQMLRQCNSNAYLQNKGNMVLLAEYSRDCLAALRAELSLCYDHRTQGTLQLFRDQKQLRTAQRDIDILVAQGVEHQLLDVGGCIDYEPALSHVADRIVGGLRMPGDETGDCFKFTASLTEHCSNRGVEFLFDTEITDIELGHSRVIGLSSDATRFEADKYVLACGSFSALLSKKIGIKLPIYPVKGYSLTANVLDDERAPQSTVMDETYKVAVTRLGNRIRVGGTAELTGYDVSLPESRKRNLDFVLDNLYPGSAEMCQRTYWTGLRPMTPWGSPIIGQSPIENLFFNTGHGTLGWTMGPGSGHLIADIISSKNPGVSAKSYQLALRR